MARPDARRPAATVVLALFLALAAGTLAACGGGSGPELQGLVRSKPYRVGDVTVPEVAEDGATTPFTFAARPGHVLFVYFGYTNCPDLCPTTLADLRGALRQLGPDAGKVDVAFLTVDPDRDTPDVIVPYLGSFVRGGHALRADDPAQLEAAKEAFGVTSSVTTDASGEVQVTHSAISYLVDEHGTVVDEWPFGMSSDNMANDLGILVDQASGAST